MVIKISFKEENKVEYINNGQKKNYESKFDDSTSRKQLNSV